MSTPALLIAGTTSGVGKTTVSLAIMYGLRHKVGCSIQPFKVGPDFIDPSYHKMVTGKDSRTLDAWMMGSRGIIKNFADSTQDVDVAVIEGVMGLYDGISGKSNFASTAYVAKLLKAQIILVIDAAKAARSIAAMALGYIQFDNETKIVGIILNNVSGARHAKYIVEAFKNIINVPILGIIHRSKLAKLKERHLGLIPANELGVSKKRDILMIARRVSESIDYENLMKLLKIGDVKKARIKTRKSYNAKIKIGVALDNSFNFYYNENLNSLRLLGGDLKFFSPLLDKELPEGISGLIIGGGFPEILANKLSTNYSMRKSIKTAAEQGLPIYAECGGLMYLTKAIRGYKNFKSPIRMVGLIDAQTSMSEKLTLNYTKADLQSSVYGRIPHLKGHEFHYSGIQDIPRDSKYAYTLKRGYGIDGKHDGILVYNTLASYMHLHFHDARLPRNWVHICKSYSRK
jgi:cobyrinic acid a,c-diamide synthase